MLIKPKINIRPFCIFCNRSTDHVACHTYIAYSRRPVDEIFIRFPAHKRCLLLRKLFRFSGLVVGAAVFFGMGILISRLVAGSGEVSWWPLWLWPVVLIAGAVSGFYCALRIHFKTVDTIYNYYVLNEVVPEADKDWRR